MIVFLQVILASMLGSIIGNFVFYQFYEGDKKDPSDNLPPPVFDPPRKRRKPRIISTDDEELCKREQENQ